MADVPRGIRNANPGNIRKGDRWQGLDVPPDDGEFCRFTDSAYGIRALARVLITYQDKRLAKDGTAIDTVRDIIERWAPPKENDTESYIRSVRQATGFRAGEELDLHDFDTMDRLVRAIIRHECGQQPYSDSEIRHGLRLAGIEGYEEPPKPLAKSRTVKAASAIGGASILGAVAEHADEASTIAQSPLVTKLIDYAPYILASIAIVAVAWIIWARIDDRSKAVR